MSHTHRNIRPTPTLAASVVTLAALVALSACSSDSSNDERSTEQTEASTSAGADSEPLAFNTASTTAAPYNSSSSATPGALAVAPGATPITITADGQTFTATLNDSQVSRDFIATLPVTLDWYRNYDIEYITELEAPMTETGPFYTDVQPGDLVYYNPMDSITVIYEETSSVPTLTKMGEVISDLTAFRDLPDEIEMRVELG